VTETPAQTRPQALRTLAARWHAAPREAFLAANGWHALLLSPSPPDPDFDETETASYMPSTPPKGSPLQSTTTSQQSPVQRALGHADSFVIPIVKSDRNAFTDMITVGRATNNDILLPVPSVSKLHGYFKRDGERWRYHDASAMNGTWVARRRLEPGEVVELTDGLELHFGPEVQTLWTTPEGLHAILRLIAKKA
jgi:pSer/pThr/pTyr-binding forkhead associated (FHA) protein